jgi:hypothetical protein
MITHFFEATNGFNHGKFMVGVFSDEEWNRRSVLPALHGGRLLTCLGWGRGPRDLHSWVMDLQTGEGMYVRLGGCAEYDLNGAHQIHVCPLFLPFLRWLYEQDTSDLADLSSRLVTLTYEQAPASFSGHRGTRYAAGDPDA